MGTQRSAPSSAMQKQNEHSASALPSAPAKEVMEKADGVSHFQTASHYRRCSTFSQCFASPVFRSAIHSSVLRSLSRAHSYDSGGPHCSRLGHGIGPGQEVPAWLRHIGSQIHHRARVIIFSREDMYKNSGLSGVSLQPKIWEPPISKVPSKKKKTRVPISRRRKPVAHPNQPQPIYPQTAAGALSRPG